MAITDTFRSSVLQGDVRGIRIMMKDSLLVDPTFNEFNEMDNLANGVTGLYDDHDGRELDNDISAWNDNYMNKLMVQIVRNFSHKRVDHLKNVVRYLRPDASHSKQKVSTDKTVTSTTLPNSRTQTSSNNYQKQKSQDEESGRIISYRGAKIATGAVVGGVVGGVIASFASVPVLVGAAGGAVVVGSLVVVATNGE